MKITYQEIVQKEAEVKYLQVSAGVRYWEDSKVDGVEDTLGILIPCREGDYWKPLIDVDTGQIVNWEKGVTADIHYKVCDDGEYWLQDKDEHIIIGSLGYYVPDRTLAIDDRGYGDYIIMSINKEGYIKNWKLNLDDFVKEIEESEE